MWYDGVEGEPRIPIQGDELVTEYADGAGTNVKVPLLQYVPMAWAPYFMAGLSPEVARQTLRRLMEGNTKRKTTVLALTTVSALTVL